MAIASQSGCAFYEHLISQAVPRDITLSSDNATVPVFCGRLSLSSDKSRRQVTAPGYRKVSNYQSLRHACRSTSGENEYFNSGSDSADNDNSPENSTTGSVPISGARGDWRAFRARLVSLEKFDSDLDIRISESQYLDEPVSHQAELCSETKERNPSKWAHPLSSLEEGCILVATEKLDGYAFFERSVVLLFNASPDKGPWGLVLNKLHPQKVGKIKGMSSSISKAFKPCKAFVGGPLDHQKYILMHGVRDLKGFQEVVPGAYIGGVLGIDSALATIKDKKAKPEVFRFFFGYAGWDYLQLENEIKLGLWHIAACSSDLVLDGARADLWEEILTLMGDKYAELARRKL